MDFGEVLTKAGKIIWKFKVLWIFGILSSCGQGGGGGGGGGNSGIRSSGGDISELPPGMRSFFYGFENFFENIEGWQVALLIIGLILFVILLSVIFTAISTVGRVGLIQGTVKAEDGAESMTFGELFESGKPFFWRIFGFNILAGLAVTLIVLILMLPLIGIALLTMGIGMICLIPFLCILIPVSWLAAVIFEQVNIAIVVEDLSMVDGFKRGWEVFRENIGNMIVMALILVLGGGIVGFVLAIPFIFMMLPFLIGIIGGASSGSDFLFGGGMVAAGICFVTYLPVLIVLGGILQAYIKTAWTLTYLHLAGTAGAEAALEEPVPAEDL